MITLKKEQPFSEDKCTESFIAPEKSGEPLIRVRNKIENMRFEADFSADLLGVVKGRETGDFEKNSRGVETVETGQLCTSLLTGLYLGQEVAFVYRAGKDGLDNHFLKWSISGKADGGTAQEAAYAARQLWQNLSVVLGGMAAGYRFAPVTEAATFCGTEEKKKWIGTVRPMGMAVNVGGQMQVGFTTKVRQGKDRSVIVTHHRETRLENRIDTMIAGSLSCPSNIEIILAITPVMISSGEQKMIGEALKWLSNGETKQISYSDAFSQGTEEEDVLKGLQNCLNNWLKSPMGYRISCSAASDKPIPASFLALLGGIFNCPVTLSLRNTEQEKRPDGETRQLSDTGTLDLRDCFKGGTDVPDLFPSPKALAACGAKTVFRQTSFSSSSDGILLGALGSGGIAREVRFSRKDRSRHAYIVGATGTGKSTLLYNMIRSDIENGEGVALLDPHGDLYQQVLDTIPEERAKDVVLIDPCDFQNSVGINFLECNDFYKPAQMNFVVNEMIRIFDRLYDLRTSGGPIFEQYMRNAMFLAMDNDLDRATLMDVPMIFEDERFRRYLKVHCKNRIVADFWTKTAERAGGEASLSNIAPYVTSKLNQFIHNALLRPIIGQFKSTINFREVMDRGKILLVNLSKGLIGELDSQLLGMLVMGKIFTAALARTNQPADERRPFFLYIDEFQNFTTGSVSGLLSEARKYGVSLTLANQNLTQLKAANGDQRILDSVLGNTASMLIMRTGVTDSEKLEMYTKPELRAQDLQELPDFHAAGRLLMNGSPTRPFVFKTLPKPSNAHVSSAERIKAASAARYSRPTASVEEEIMARRKVPESYSKPRSEI
jgi:hypothetical protein